MLKGIPSLLRLGDRLQISNMPAKSDEPSSRIGTTLISGSMIVCTAGAIAFKVLNINGTGTDPIIGTLLPFAASVCLQQAFQVSVPRKWSNIEKTFLADYAAPLFLIASQIYINIPNLSAEAKQAILAGLTAHAGLCSAALVHTWVTRRLSEQEENLPLIVSSEPDPQKLRIAVLNSSPIRLGWSGIKVALGIGAIIIGTQVQAAAVARDYGIILAGDGVGQLICELWLRRIIPLQNEVNASLLSPQSSFPKELKLYYTATKIFLAVAHVLPGALIVLANAAAGKDYSLAISIPCYAFAGIFSGGKRHIERARFTKLPLSQLDELKKQPDTLTTLEKVFSVGKWAIATAGVGGFIGLGIAGFNFANWQFEKVQPLDQAALATFAFFLYGSYALAEVAKRKFKPGENSWIENSLYFYTHYSQGIPRFALYIMNKMQIGDEALSGYSIPVGILVCAAYADLGYGIGIEANTRGEFQSPTVLSSLATALFGKFIAAEFLKQV